MINNHPATRTMMTDPHRSPRLRMFARAQAAGRSLAGAQTGTALIEFALVAPIFLAFLMGIIAFGSFFGYAPQYTTILPKALIGP